MAFMCGVGHQDSPSDHSTPLTSLQRVCAGVFSENGDDVVVIIVGAVSVVGAAVVTSLAGGVGESVTVWVVADDDVGTV